MDDFNQILTRFFWRNKFMDDFNEVFKRQCVVQAAPLDNSGDIFKMATDDLFIKMMLMDAVRIDGGHWLDSNVKETILSHICRFNPEAIAMDKIIAVSMSRSAEFSDNVFFLRTSQNNDAMQCRLWGIPMVLYNHLLCNQVLLMRINPVQASMVINFRC